MTRKAENLVLTRRALLPVLVFALAVVVYGQYGFDGELRRDHAIYLYSGQRMAEGIPPYVSIFDHKGPLAPMLAGLGVMISEQLGWDDIYTVRAVFFVVGCVAVVSVYALGNGLFRSRRVGAFAALTFLGFFGFAQYAASGPEPKVPMVLFQVLSLLLTSRRRWFWAGVCGSLSFLVWLPMAIFPLVTLFLATVQPRRGRTTAMVLALAGIGLPLVAVSAYFWYHDAFGKLLDGSILFNVFYGDREEQSVLSHFLAPVRVALHGYGTAFLPILVGFAMIVYLLFSRTVRHGSLGNVLKGDALAPVLLTFPVVVLWSLLDFQWYPDLYVFLPYVAVGFGRFLDLVVRRAEGSEKPALPGGVGRLLTLGLCAFLVVLAAVNALAGINDRLRSGFAAQKRATAQIEERFGRDAKLVSIGVPQVLVLSHRSNPNPHAFIGAGIDQYIHANTPGGFEGWLRELQEYDPDVIAFGKTKGVHKQELMSWLRSRYHEERVGPWRLFVKNTLDK